MSVAEVVAVCFEDQALEVEERLGYGAIECLEGYVAVRKKQT